MTNVLVSTHNVIYIPTFNSTTGKYYDLSPYQKNQRNCQVYECRCRASSSFRGNSEFKQHTKSKTHKDFVNNYTKYYLEVDQQNEEIKRHRIDNDKKDREIKRLNKLYEKIKLELESESTKLKLENDQLGENLVNRNNKISTLINDIKDKNNFIDKLNEEISNQNIVIRDNIEEISQKNIVVKEFTIKYMRTTK